MKPVFAAIGMAAVVATAAAHEPKIVNAGKGEPVAVPFHPVEQLLSGHETAAGVTFYLSKVPPNSAGAPPHIHAHEDEFFYVVSGEMTFLSEDDVIAMGPGGFAALTRDHLHGFWNASDEEAVVLMAATKGGFEQFFDDVAREVSANPDLSPAEVGDIVGRLAAERGITIRMDRVPEEAKALYGQ